MMPFLYVVDYIVMLISLLVRPQAKRLQRNAAV